MLGAVVRRYGHFDIAEDATQEALLAAFRQWPQSGIPDNPRGWLITVAARRMTDLLRNEQARRRREEAAGPWSLSDEWASPVSDGTTVDADDSLILLFMCCHPSLTTASQIALTLRAVGGLTTDEIARAFLVPTETMTRRIGRAKRLVKESRLPFRLPPPTELPDRLRSVLHILYLIFNEGYASTSGGALVCVELSLEAIRLTRVVHLLFPEDGEVKALLALMLLTDARRPARIGAYGELIPMREQDRGLWNADYIVEGLALVSAALPGGAIGPYQLQAAIAAIHDEAPNADATDWPQIVALYELLMRISDNPVVALNHAVAVAMVRGPPAGLKLLSAIGSDSRIAEDHRLYSVRAHLTELAGDPDTARDLFMSAAARTSNLAQQRYLHGQATRLTKS